MRICLTWFALGLLLAAGGTSRAENWPQFRGPAASGLTSEGRLPTRWGPQQNIAWKVELPGMAWSQPVVWGDRIFVTTAVTDNQAKPNLAQPFGGGGRGGPGGGRRGPGPGPADRNAPGADEDRGGDAPQGKAPPRQRPEGAEGERPNAEPGAENAPRGPAGRGGPGGRAGFGRGAAPPDQVYRWMVMCLDRATGKVLWEQLAHQGKPTTAIHRTNTYASETPITDGQRVIAYFGATGLYCFDLDGKLLWSKNLGSYPMMMGWGTGSSPALDGDRLFVQCDNEKDSFLVAIDKRSGDELWRVARDEKSNWSTPLVWKNKVRTELVTAGHTMRSYDPATGKLLWELADIRGRCSATPLGTEELLYVGVGGGQGGSGPLVAIRAGAEGTLSLDKDDASPGIAWSVSRAGPPMASPLVYQGCLYVLEQRGGLIACYDAATGKQHYRQRIEGAKGFTASPWAAAGNVFCLDEDGQTFVLAPGSKLEVLATNKLDDAFWSSASVASDHLLLRGVKALYSIAPETK